MAKDCHVYHNLSDLLAHRVGKESDYPNKEKYTSATRHWVRLWKSHRSKNGPIPLVIRKDDAHTKSKPKKWRLSDFLRGLSED